MTITAAIHATSVDPASGERLTATPWTSAEEVDHALNLAVNGYNEWKHTSVKHRAQTLRQIGQALRHRAEEMAGCISREVGKPIKQARAEAAKSAALRGQYAEHRPAMFSPKSTLVENNQAVIEYRPAGTTLATMPWNFPLWQVMRGAVPILLTGNGYLLKHTSNIIDCAAIIAQVFADAGVPVGVYGWVNVDNTGVNQMINDPRIATITVTGSVRTGVATGAQAGTALKKCMLELGGSDPFVVLNDADLDLAVKAVVAGHYQNTGRICAAVKHFIIEEGIAVEFTSRFVAAASVFKMGDPLSEGNDLGPMVRLDLRDELHQQVEAALAGGARLLLGGEEITNQGNYYATTVLGDVTPETTAFRQKLFGPVAAITVAKDAEHALALMNNSDFGLSATAFTADEALAQKVASCLECGGVFINGYSASDARVAFGGVEKSDFGHELLHSGLHEFCNVQTIWRNHL